MTEQTFGSDLSLDSSTANVSQSRRKEEGKWVTLSCEQIGEPMLSALKDGGAFTIDGRPGLFFVGFEGQLPCPKELWRYRAEWQWRPGEQQGAYELMRRLIKREDVPAETPQSRLDQQSEREVSTPQSRLEHENGGRSRGVASSSLDEVSDAETLIMGPGGEVIGGNTNRAD